MMVTKGYNPIADLQEAGKQLMSVKPSSDYGQIFLKEGGSGEVWYVLADGDDREFEDVVNETLMQIEGIDEITFEAEGYPPRGEGWIQVFPKEKEWKSLSVGLLQLPKILEVPNVQQEYDYDCGPSALASVAQYFGEQGTPVEYAKLMGTDMNNGTDPSAMCHLLNQLGFNYEDRDDLQIQDLQRHIEQGHPIIVAIQDYEETPADIVNQRAGHWVVVIGADDENVYIQDPSAYETNGRVVMPALEFLARWQDYAGIIPDNDTQYVHYGIAVSGSLSGEIPMGKAMKRDAGIIEDDDGFWVVEGDNDERVYGPYDTREEALQIMSQEYNGKSVDKDRMGIGGQYILVGDDAIGWRITDWDGMPETNDTFASRAEAIAWMRQNGLIKDAIPGGLADEANPSQFDPEQLALGIQAEMEHTGDEALAREIAMDHLMESPTYYTELLAMEGNKDGWGANATPLPPNQWLEAEVRQDANGSWTIYIGNNAFYSYGSQALAEHYLQMLQGKSKGATMDINDIALQFCGLLSIGKKASPEIMGMLRRKLNSKAIYSEQGDDGQWYVIVDGNPMFGPFDSEERARRTVARITGDNSWLSEDEINPPKVDFFGEGRDPNRPDQY